MKFYYESGYEVKVGDIVLVIFDISSFNLYTVYEICSNGEIKYNYLGEHNIPTMVGQPDEHMFLVSRFNSNKLMLKTFADKKNYNADKGEYYYNDGAIVKIGDLVVYSGRIRCKIIDIELPSYEKCFGGGIYLAPLSQEPYAYYFIPYITDDVIRI